eukprot:m.202757 g.202757  ORF g.202757 m.202757 type:complete len:433 (-) comp15754_c0_seq11:2155-3453(-)
MIQWSEAAIKLLSERSKVTKELAKMLSFLALLALTSFTEEHCTDCKYYILQDYEFNTQDLSLVQKYLLNDHSMRTLNRQEAAFIMVAYGFGQWKKNFNLPPLESHQHYVVFYADGLEECCRCGSVYAWDIEPPSLHTHNHRLKEDHDSLRCQAARRLYRRSDVIIVKLDAFEGSLCCKDKCPEMCDFPSRFKNVTVDPFRFKNTVTKSKHISLPILKKPHFASFRGKCHRGWWSSSKVRIDLHNSVAYVNNKSNFKEKFHQDIVYDCGQLFEQAKHMNDPDLLLRPFVCCENFDHDNKVLGCNRMPCSAGNYRELMHNSIFMFCPHGDQRWSHRLMEGLSLSTIPIIISDGVTLPYEQIIDWKSFAVQIAEKDVASGESLYNILSRLRSDEDDLKKRHAQLQLVYEKYLSTLDKRVNTFLLALKVESKAVLN